MTLLELKGWVISLSEEELKQDFLYNSENYSLSGVIEKIEIAKDDLYYEGDDDPSKLSTKKQLLEEGYEEEDIEELDIEIPKGSFYISF